MKQCQKIKQNYAGEEIFEICFWVIFDHYYQIFHLRKEDWVLGSVYCHFCDIPNIS